MAGVFVLDKALILDRLGGDEEIYAMMVDMFLQDVDNTCDALAAALASGDATVLANQGHLASQAEAVAGLLQRVREVAAVLSTG